MKGKPQPWVEDMEEVFPRTHTFNPAFHGMVWLDVRGKKQMDAARLWRGSPTALPLAADPGAEGMRGWDALCPA